MILPQLLQSKYEIEEEHERDIEKDKVNPTMIGKGDRD